MILCAYASEWDKAAALEADGWTFEQFDSKTFTFSWRGHDWPDSGGNVILEARTMIEDEKRRLLADGWTMRRQEGSTWILLWHFTNVWPSDPRRFAATGG